MQHEWVIRVLEDLQRYAQLHMMPALVEHLDQARLLALTEIAGLAPDPSQSQQGGAMIDGPTPLAQKRDPPP